MIRPDNKQDRSYHHGNLREALLSAAFDLLDEGSSDAVTIRAVARATGVAHSAPANHFRNRPALLVAMVERIQLDLLASLEGALNRSDSTDEEKIVSFSRTLVDFGIAHPHRYRLLWGGAGLVPREQALLQNETLLWDRLIELFSRNGKFDPETRIIAYWSMIHGYIRLRIDGPLDLVGTDRQTGQSPPDAIIEIALRLMA